MNINFEIITFPVWEPWPVGLQLAAPILGNFPECNSAVWDIPAEPGARLEDMSGALNSIARKYNPAGGMEREDYLQNAALKLLERSHTDPDFLERPDAQILKFADWRTINLLESTAIYSRYVGAEDYRLDPEGKWESTFDTLRDDSPLPEEVVIWRERMHEIERTAQRLGEMYYLTCVMLACGYSESEVARYCGVSRGAITQRLTTIRREINEV